MALSFHWLTLALVIVAWALGSFDDVLPRGSARAPGLFVHISACIAIATMLVVRLAWRVGDPPPPAETTPLTAWADRAGRLAHIALYALLIAVPVSGIVLQFARGNALPLFGLYEVTSPWMADRAFARSVKEVHEILANALVILAAFHAGAALFSSLGAQRLNPIPDAAMVGTVPPLNASRKGEQHESTSPAG